MRLGCPRCGIDLEYSTQPPRFCSNCGQSLSTASGTPQRGSDAPTLPNPPGVDILATLPYQPVPTGTPAAGRYTPAMPESIGGYRLRRPLGGGGMGTVYEAEETATGRAVAVKLIRPEFAGSEETVERFRREGRLASTILHPRCVFVIAADEEAGRPYIVMELMPGTTLHDLVEKQGPLPVPEAVGRILDVIDGLQEAHRCGVIHRDVKPSNCFLDADGRVKVGDFGLAKALVASEELTRTGGFLGTILYAAPEQIRNDQVNHLADVYSVCATLYYLLTGRAPFQDLDPAAALARAVSDPVPPLRDFRAEIPRTLEEVVLRGLSRNRRQRWQGLEELRLALLPFLRGPECVATPGWRISAYLCDMLAVLPAELLLMWALIRLGVGGGRGLDHLVLSCLVGLGIGLLYFAIPESVWGCSPGKWLMRLRVRETASADRPGVGQSSLRTALFYLFKDLPALLIGPTLLYLGGSLIDDPDTQVTTRVFLSVLLVGVVPFLSTGLGFLLLAIPMRRRNGYRALHDWVSGTELIRLPNPRPRLVVPTRPAVLPAAVSGEPERIGTFQVRGVLRSTGDERVLLAEDTLLSRPVWVWMRPAAAAPLPAAQRAVSRATRPRWLAAGTHDGWQWDAFVATPGCPLGDLASRKRPLGWADAWPLLDQLAGELQAAEAEGTLPERLSPEQVWVQPGGRLVLLDIAPRPPVPVDTPLDLLRQTAAVTLEGQPRPSASLCRPVRAPVPAHAIALLDRLMSPDCANVAAVRDDLLQTRDLPDEINRPARAIQVGLGAVAAVPGLLVLFALGPAILIAAYMVCVVGHAAGTLKEAQLDECLAAAAPPAGPAREQWLEDQRLRDEVCADLQRLTRDREAVLASWGWFMRRGLQPLETRFNPEFEERLRRLQDDPEAEDKLDFIVTESDDLLSGPSALAGEYLHDPLLFEALAFWPLLWAFWAGLTRGGLALRVAGIALVGRDGRPAARWRCFLRTLLFWLPVLALLSASLALDLWRVAETRTGWSDERIAVVGSLAWHAWWLTVLFLVGSVFAAITWPGRHLHDLLAGTYPVPR
ncbi:MAG: protein kinase [Gemmataceae bacterium]